MRLLIPEFLKLMNYLTNLLAIPVAHAATLKWSQFSFGINTNGTAANLSTAQNLLLNIVNIFLIVVFIIAFIYLVLYGVQYITSGGDAEKATKARNGIINAIIGIIVIVLAYFIIQFAVGIGTGVTSGGTIK